MTKTRTAISAARPRASDMLERQLGMLGPLTRPRRRARCALSRFISLLTLAALAALAAGQAMATPDDEEVAPAVPGVTAGPGAGTLLLRTPGGDVEAPRLDTRVSIEIGGMLARVKVSQRFHNPGAEHVEGTYVFPLPDDAAVDEMSLRIGQRLIVGEIQEKEQARRTYARARDAGQRASLVEQHRPNLFRTAVANIGPGETIEVDIGYLQTLPFVQGTYRLRFPMTVTPRFTPAAPLQAALAPSQNPTASRDGTGATPAQSLPGMDWSHALERGNEIELALELAPGFPLARIESLYHEMEIVQAGDHYSVRSATGPVPMNRDFELVWQPALGATPEAAVFTETWQGQPFAMLMLMPSAAAAVAAPPREVVLIIDTSGSMSGSSITQARDALRFALQRLAPQDRFNVIRFDDEASALFREAMPVDPGYLLRAQRFVDSLQADGGTNIAAALAVALDEQADARAAADGYLRQVVFITDGSVGNEEQLFGDIARRLGQTRLFTVGIGSAPNDWFMRKAAQFGRGTFTHIGADHMIEERMESLLTRLESPVLRDIEIAAPPGAEIWPERIRDLYAGEPIVIRARLQKPAGRFSLRGSSAGVAWQRELELHDERAQPGVAALWGRAQIEELLDSLVTGANADEVRTRVVDLALRHHLVSRYTSLVAVDRTPERAPGMPLVQKALRLNAPAGAAMLGYPAGATPAALLGLGGLFSLLLSSTLARAGRRRRAAGSWRERAGRLQTAFVTRAPYRALPGARRTRR